MHDVDLHLCVVVSLSLLWTKAQKHVSDPADKFALVAPVWTAKAKWIAYSFDEQAVKGLVRQC